MAQYLSPLSVEGKVKSNGNSTVALAATTIFTTPNTDEYNGAVYAADVYLRVRTLDGGTTPTVTIGIIATDTASARTSIVPLANEAGTYTAAGVATLAAVGSFSGKIVFRADKNTNVQYVLTAGGTPSNNGVFDVFIQIYRVA